MNKLVNKLGNNIGREVARKVRIKATAYDGVLIYSLWTYIYTAICSRLDGALIHTTKRITWYDS